jgi:hypothetical protein
MPNLQLSWQEAADIASWLLSVPAEWPLEVEVPGLDARDERGRPFVQDALDELIRLYKDKSGTPLSQLDRVVQQMSRDDKLMYLGERSIGRLGASAATTSPASRSTSRSAPRSTAGASRARRSSTSPTSASTSTTT